MLPYRLMSYWPGNFSWSCLCLLKAVIFADICNNHFIILSLFVPAVHLLKSRLKISSPVHKDFIWKPGWSFDVYLTFLCLHFFGLYVLNFHRYLFSPIRFGHCWRLSHKASVQFQLVFLFLLVDDSRAFQAGRRRDEQGRRPDLRAATQNFKSNRKC